jgi:hypothetical protein
MNLIKGFVGPAYEAPSLSVNNQRCINMLVEVDQTQAKTPTALYGVPGLRELADFGVGVTKNYIEVNGEMYGAVGQNFGRIESDLTTFTVLGTFSGTARITLVDNGLQVLLIDGLSGFVWDIAAMTWTQITDPGFVYGATQGTYQDGYGIVGLPNSQQFGISGLYNFLVWDAIDFASAEGLPDDVSTVISNNRILYVLGTGTFEPWYNSGNGTFPFQRIDGGFREVGCSAPYSAAIADDSVFWLGNNLQGSLAIFRTEGQTPKRISTVALENELANYEVVDDAFGIGLDIRRHPIYMLVFPTENKTWCYDAHSGSWFEWLEWSGPDFNRYRLNCFAKAFGKLLVGDYRDGRMYEMSFDVFMNGDDPIRTLRQSPYVWVNGKRIFHSRLEVLIEPGVGLLTGDTDAVDPQWSLRWSNDGRTWSNEITRPMGRFGVYDERMIFNRLGSARNRIYEMSSTAPVKRVIYGATLDAS